MFTEYVHEVIEHLNAPYDFESGMSYSEFLNLKQECEPEAKETLSLFIAEFNHIYLDSMDYYNMLLDKAFNAISKEIKADDDLLKKWDDDHGCKFEDFRQEQPL
jgi:hypothetical protein